MGNVIRICDYERRSREPDAQAERDPANASVIILPVVRERCRPEPPCDVGAPNLKRKSR